MAATMQAVVFQGEGKWAVESSPMPQIAVDDEVPRCELSNKNKDKLP